MEVRDRIIEGAGKLFLTEGIRRVTMDYIAKKLAISKRTIYEMFQDKTELVKATLEYLTRKHDEEFNAIQKDAGNVIEVIVGVLQVGVTSIKQVSPLFLDDLELHYPVLCEETIVRRRRESMLNFEHLITRGIDEGMFRADLNVRLVAKIFIEQMNAMNNRNVFPPDEYPAVELFETLFLNFIRGISTLEGIRKLEELLLNRNELK